MKKKWQTPELIVLFKGRPEETLLCHCKHKTAPPVAPYNHKDNCTSESALLPGLFRRPLRVLTALGQEALIFS